MKPTRKQLSVPFVADELIFDRMLELECRRSERTGTPFGLAVVDLDSLDRALEPSELSSLIESVSAGMRETDVTGWYGSPSTIGIILTTLDGTVREILEGVVSDRIRQLLSRHLDPEEAKSVEVLCYVFPEDRNCDPTEETREKTFASGQNPQNGSIGSAVVKRCVDVAGSLFALIVFAPAFVVISALIKLTSRGPVFFQQTRVGQHGREFTCLKFRSMEEDNDAEVHREFVSRYIEDAHNEDGVYKLTNDSRITAVGRFIRKFSLDELPQFLNVLRGDMSLVGPRPPIPYELEMYALWHLRRIQEAKPGLTGAWQVRGRSRTTFDEMVRMDLRYIRHRSFWMDVRIMLETPLAVLRGGGAH